jgi:biotin transport system permease protein
MNAHHQLFGLYTPGDSALHRLEVGPKFALVLAVSLFPLLVRDMWVSLALLAVTVILVLSTRLGARRCLVLMPAIWIMAAMLMAYQLLWGDWRTGVMLMANLVL